MLVAVEQVFGIRMMQQGVLLVRAVVVQVGELAQVNLEEQVQQILAAAVAAVLLADQVVQVL
jgi:hypothetical protein